MVETIDGGWGSLKDDGTWTGMIGMILRDEVDIAISDFYVTAERSMVIDYSQKIVELMYVLIACFTNTKLSISDLHA